MQIKIKPPRQLVPLFDERKAVPRGRRRVGLDGARRRYVLALSAERNVVGRRGADPSEIRGAEIQEDKLVVDEGGAAEHVLPLCAVDTARVPGKGPAALVGVLEGPVRHEQLGAHVVDVGTRARRHRHCAVHLVHAIHAKLHKVRERVCGGGKKTGVA